MDYGSNTYNGEYLIIVMKYKKLVRDKIPEHIEKKGERAVYHVADDEEYRVKLVEKLKEEVEEFVRDERVEELADILEVIDAIAAYKKYDVSEIQKVKEQKAEEKGAFERRIILDES